MISEYALARIEAIQQELDALKKTIAHEITGLRRKTKLKGLWKGVPVNQEDFDEAERAVFRGAYQFEE